MKVVQRWRLRRALMRFIRAYAMRPYASIGAGLIRLSVFTIRWLTAYCFDFNAGMFKACSSV